jgi:hypothetical protein
MKKIGMLGRKVEPEVLDASESVPTRAIQYGWMNVNRPHEYTQVAEDQQVKFSVVDEALNRLLQGLEQG